MADQEENRIFGRFLKVFQYGIGTCALQIIGSIDDDYAIFGNRSLVLKQRLQGTYLIDFYIAGQLMLIQRVQTIVAGLLFLFVAFWSAAEQAEIRMRASGKKMTGFVVLHLGKHGRSITGIEQKMSGLLGKRCFAQSLVSCQNPGMMKLVLGKGLGKYLSRLFVAEK
nr:hypothetical protein [Sphingorhabdus sp. M41]